MTKISVFLLAIALFTAGCPHIVTSSSHRVFDLNQPIPEQIGKRSNLPYAVILPEIPALKGEVKGSKPVKLYRRQADCKMDYPAGTDL